MTLMDRSAVILFPPPPRRLSDLVVEFWRASRPIAISKFQAEDIRARKGRAQIWIEGYQGENIWTLGCYAARATKDCPRNDFI
jgi:hypothetical protein